LTAAASTPTTASLEIFQRDPDSKSPTLLRVQDSSDVAAAGLAPELPTEILGVGNLAVFMPEDAQYFKILNETELSVEKTKELKIMRFLLKIKHDTPSVRKTALCQHHGQSPRFRSSAAL